MLKCTSFDCISESNCFGPGKKLEKVTRYYIRTSSQWTGPKRLDVLKKCDVSKHYMHTKKTNREHQNTLWFNEGIYIL
jgi:hypothetical protein